MENSYDLNNSVTLLKTKNKMISNTFGLLAISMIPTIIGAMASVPFMGTIAQHPLMFALIMLALNIGLYFGIMANKDNSLGIGLTLLFTGTNGFMLGPILSSYIHNYANGSVLIAQAGGLTLLALVGSYIYSVTTKKDLSFMRGFLMVGLLIFFGAIIINLFVQSSLLGLVLAGAGAILFSLFLLYDVNQVVNGGETNYVIATVQIYLDLLNLFVSLLRLLGAFQGED